MNIKSLLLGSAAAMVAVSSAQAADAIVVEPEPVEFVRVCDAYGAGFFFIPGTETCLRVRGGIRATFSKNDTEATFSGTSVSLDDVSVPTDLPDSITVDGVVIDTADLIAADVPFTLDDEDINLGGDSNGFTSRAQVVFDARNETDFGTLRGLIQLQSGENFDPSATAVSMDIALISLAGFRIGQNGANYWSSNQGFAGVSLNAVAFGTDGYYSFDDSMVFDYTYAVDGLAVTVGVENTNTGEGAGGFTNDFGDPNFANFYAGFNYANEFGDIAFTAAHDAASVDNSGDVGGWAYSISATADLSSFIPGGTLHGFFQWDDDYNTTYVGNGSPFLDEEFAWGVSYQMNLTDDVELVLLYNRAEGDTTEGEADLFTVGANWLPSAAPGFIFSGTYSFQDVEETLELTNEKALEGTLIDTETNFFEFTVRRDF